MRLPIFFRTNDVVCIAVPEGTAYTCQDLHVTSGIVNLPAADWQSEMPHQVLKYSPAQLELAAILQEAISPHIEVVSGTINFVRP